MIVAVVGLVVNLFVAWRLSRAHGNLNARGALLHVMGDLLGSVAALVAGAVIAYTGWTPIDPILSIVVSLLILRSTIALLRESIGVLMERVPSHLSYESDRPGAGGAAERDRRARPPRLEHDGRARCRVGAHDAHRRRAVAATLAAAQRMLAQDFGIHHVTLQPSWPARAPEGRVIPVVSAPSRDAREGASELR